MTTWNAHTTRPATASLAAMTAARVRLELVQFSRERDAMVFTFGLPIAIYCLFAITMTGQLQVGSQSVDHRRYMLPGLIATAVLLSSFQSTAIGVAQDRASGGLKRLRTTPMPPAAFFLAKVCLVLVTSAVQIALLMVIAHFGFGVPGPLSWGRLLATYGLGVAAGTTSGIAFSSLLRNARSAPTVVAGLTLLMQFICGVFFVFSSLPGWVQHVALVLPLTWLARGMRSALLPPELASVEIGGGWQTGLTLVVIAVWFVVTAALCLRTFRWVDD